MILTYYQSVELMAFLPVLLSPSDSKTSSESAYMAVPAEDNATEDTSGIYQMWNIPTNGMEVNGADFY